MAPAKKIPAAPVQAAPPVPEVPEPVAPVVASETVEDKPAASAAPDFDGVIGKVLGQSASAKDLLSEVRALHKAYVALVKENAKLTAQLKKAQEAAAKPSAKAKAKADKSDAEKKPRSPSGFVRPTLLSDDLCAFLGVDKGAELARTDVTRRINAYIKANNLEDPSDKRKIIPDQKLQSILRMTGEENETTSYFTLQKLIKHHFAKSVKKSDEAAAAPSAVGVVA
jgi:chromatin remodeling complex protein RSC6